MTEDFDFTLINPQNDCLAFRLVSFDNAKEFDHLLRHNYYSLIWITKGSGKAKADFQEYSFNANTLFAFSPYQPFMFSTDKMHGVALYFHSDFFCIYRHHPEIACSVLFNNIYEPPFIEIDKDSNSILETVLSQIKIEVQKPELAQYELLVSYLKIFLITCIR